MKALWRRRLLAFVALSWVGLLAPPSVMAESPAALRREPTREHKIYDAAVVRPLAFGNLIVAAAIFPVAYPVTLVTGGREYVERYCWNVPLERLVRRPLGEL